MDNSGWNPDPEQTSEARAASEVFQNRVRVLYDGWPLVYRPNSPAALHLLAVLASLPEEVEAYAALPGPSPHRLPEWVEQIRLPTENKPSAQLQWEQRNLPAAAENASASILHLAEMHPPLSGQVPVIVSPAEISASTTGARSISERLRSALAMGAAGSIQALLWPQDLECPPGSLPCYPLPPLVHPAFLLSSAARLDLPGDYVLYHGSTQPRDLQHLLESWTWSAGAVGELFPLVLAGLLNDEQSLVETLAKQAGLSETVQIVDAATIEDWAALYKQSSAVVTLGPALAWGSPVLLAMAAGKPLAGPEDAWNGQRVGPTAYLVPPEDARALGAAMTTLVVETELSAGLGQAASERAAQWDSPRFGKQLLAVYRRIMRK